MKKIMVKIDGEWLEVQEHRLIDATRTSQDRVSSYWKIDVLEDIKLVDESEEECEHESLGQDCGCKVIHDCKSSRPTKVYKPKIERLDEYKMAGDVDEETRELMEFEHENRSKINQVIDYINKE